MRRTALLIVGISLGLLSGADAASAFITGNTIDELATGKQHGRLVRVTGPIACTRGERIAIRITVAQPVTEARVRGRCRGEVQRWQATAGTRRGTRFEPGRGKPVAAADVCFTVNNVGDPIPSTVRGTLFRSRKRFHSSSTALLLQHGAVSERSAWNGGAPVIEGTHDTARSLARRGYAVFAIDRLGYGDSPYERPPGSGLLLTPDGYIEMTHQMVTQIRAGSYTDCAGKAAGRGAPRVVLSGFSSGGAIVEGYATRYHDIDGIIPMFWSNQPQLSAAFQELVGVLVPQLAGGRDYVEFFFDGADGYSEFCQRAFFYVPGVKARVLEQLCGPDYYAQTAWPTPSGEAALPALQANTVATIGNVGPTPVLLVFSDRDALFPGPERRGTDPDVVTPEIAMWRNGCNCEVSVYVQPDAGHVGTFHRTSKKVTRRILDWLDQHHL
jgi:pimeloyl-ACP methyl ester carboxylesterase